MALELPFLTPNAGATFSPTADLLSGFSTDGLSSIGSSALGQLGEATGIGFLKPARKVGTVIPECVIEESTRDDMEITRHPIETGAAISDHTFKLPTEIVIRAGWSDAGSLPGYSKRAFEALLALQLTQEPFAVITGKKTYPSMLIASISQQTNSGSENALIATIVCRQVKIVRVASVQIAPAMHQVAPQATGATQAGGDRQAQPAATSTTSPASAGQPLTVLGAAQKLLGGAGDFLKGLLH